MPAGNSPAPISMNTTDAPDFDSDAHFESPEPADYDPVRIIVFNDHPVFRSGLVWKINEGSGVQVIADASSLQDTIAIAEEEAQYGLDAVLADLRMGDGNTEGIASISSLVSSLGQIPLVVCSDRYTTSQAERMTAAGASAVVQKSSGVEAVVDAILQAVAGARAAASNGRAA